MAGKQDFMTKIYTTFAGSIEDMTGPDFERGLFKLDSVVTADMKKYTVNVDGLTEHGGGFYIYNTTSCKISDMEPKMQDMMTEVTQYAVQNNIKMAGAPFTFYHNWDMDNNATMFSCCVPTTAKVISSESDILTGQMQPFKAVKVTLKGDYKNLIEAWETGMKYVADSNMEFTENGPMLEVYLTAPQTEPNPAHWITEIYIAVR